MGPAKCHPGIGKGWSTEMLSLRGHLAMSGDVLVARKYWLLGATRMLVGEARDVD